MNSSKHEKLRYACQTSFASYEFIIDLYAFVYQVYEAHSNLTISSSTQILWRRPLEK
jgi:hypothetical protein